MKKYLSVFRIKFIGGMQYRAAALAGLATQFAWGFMSILMFQAFYTADPASFPMPFPALASYMWLRQAFLMLFSVWFWENDILNAISDGAIAYELARPMDLYNRWFTQVVASRLSKAVLRCFPILLVAALLPGSYALRGPALGLPGLGLFALSALLALGVVTAMGMLVYILSFYTLNSLGLRTIIAAVSEFLAGAYVPLAFFPEGFRQVAELLPFSSMMSVPLNLYAGTLGGAQLARAMALQAFWLVALVALGRLLMHRTLRHVVVQGG